MKRVSVTVKVNTAVSVHVHFLDHVLNWMEKYCYNKKKIKLSKIYLISTQNVQSKAMIKQLFHRWSEEEDS